MSRRCCQIWCGCGRAVTPCLSSCRYRGGIVSVWFQVMSESLSALWGQHRSCLHSSNFGVIILLSQQCSPCLKHTASHWYSLVVIQKSRTYPQKHARLVAYSSLRWCRSSEGALFTLFTLPSRGSGMGREWDGASICLSRGVVGSSFTLRPRSRRFRIRSFWTASVKPADMHPAVFLTPEHFTAVFRVCCGTVISQSSRRSRLTVCLLFSRLPSTETLCLRISGPFRGCPKP